LVGIAGSWTAWRRTTTSRRRLPAAEPEPAYVYIDVAEALALFAEIKGLSIAAAESELRDPGLLESALIRARNVAHYEQADLAINEHVTELSEDELLELMFDVSRGLSPTDVAARLRSSLKRVESGA
jgi:hypothetical protein